MKKVFVYGLALVLLSVTTAAIIPIEDWKTYVFKSAGFKMSFPEKPDVKQLAEGQIISAVTESDGTIYKVMGRLNENFDLDISQALLVEAEKALLQKDDEIVSTRNLKVGGFAARQIKLRSPDGLTLICRSIITKDALFQIVMSRYDEFPDQARVNKFLESFELIK